MLTRNDLHTALIEALGGAVEALHKAQFNEPPPVASPVQGDALAGPMTMNGKLALSIVEAAEALGVGRSTAYALLKSGDLRSVRIAGRVLIPVQALVDLLAAAERVNG